MSINSVPWSPDFTNIVLNAAGLCVSADFVANIPPEDAWSFANIAGRFTETAEITNTFTNVVITNMGTIDLPNFAVLSAAPVPLSIPVSMSSKVIDLNSTADQAITITANGTTFGLDSVLIRNASTSLTTVDDVEIWTGVGRTGTKLFKINNGTSTISPGLSLLVSGNEFIVSSLVSNPAGKLFATNTIYLSCGTPQGSAATATIYLNGFIFN